MSDWAMVGVWRFILRIPPAIGKKRASQFAAKLREVAGTLSVQDRAIHHFTVRELPRLGGRMPPQYIAKSLDLSPAAVTEVLAGLEARMSFVVRDEEGAVTWAYPVTAETTPHRIRFRSGETLYAA